MRDDPTAAVARIEELLQRLYIGAADPQTGRALGLRDEDRKKAREVAALLGELSRLGRLGLVVDAAAGHGYVGLCAAEVVGLDKLIVIEREARRVARCTEAARLLAPARPFALEVRADELSGTPVLPEDADVVVALHACGAATDAILDGAVAARARTVLLAPCCHDARVRTFAAATRRAEALCMPPGGELRRRYVRALIDGDRALRLEEAGYRVESIAFVPPTVTPDNLLLRARRVGEPRRMEAARAKRAALGLSEER